MIPLSLYIHIPWCEKKCPYCDFNSHMAKAQVDEAAYVKALLADLALDISAYQQAIAGRSLTSIFIGGGTPSLFSAESIAAILRGVEAQIDFAADIEITLEANPGSAEADKFLGFRQAGLNRLSIGVQSFNQTHLSSLGRVHGRQEAIDAAGYAKQAGFETFNLDLMFGLPEQSLAESLQDVEQAIGLQPTHLSCYQLTIEPNTLFHHQPPPTPEDEALWQMQTEIQAHLAANNFAQYEVSAYALSEHQCRHNLNYWQFGDYLGIGAGAHGKITNSAGLATRNWKIKHPTSYLRKASGGDFNGGVHQVKEADLPFEFMLNALRLTAGFELALFEQRTAQNISVIEAQLNQHQTLGLMQQTEQHISLTERGKSMLNSMLQDYLV